MASLLFGATILLLGAWIITGALWKSSAAIRHAIWTCAIAATVLIAGLHWCVPQRVVSEPLPVVFAAEAASVSGGAGAEVSQHESAPGLGAIAMTVWLLGSMALTFRACVQGMQFRRLLRDAQPVNKAFPVPVLISRRIPGPLVAGIFRPMILLPGDSAAWSPGRLRAVLAHELAHVRRRDPAILLLAQAATIVYWFHPLLWFAASRLRRESERASDDAVLRIGLRPSTYAGELLDLARLFNPQPAIPMAATSHLESRVKSILNPFVNRSFAARRTWLAAALITGVCSAPLTVLSLRAQAPAGAGTIAGIVSDPTGAVVARVPVTALNLDRGNKEITTTDMAGNFTLANVPIGRYAVEAHVPGFASFRSEVTLSNGGTAQAPVRLAVGLVGDQITVVAAGSPKRVASSAVPGARPIRVGGNVQIASLLQQVRPVYPEALQAAGIEGTVLLEAIISKDGVPQSLAPQNTSIDPAFASAAMDAVRQWRYRPTLLNGEPIEVATTISVDFKLQKAQN